MENNLIKLLEDFGNNGISHTPKKGLDNVLSFQDWIGGRNLDEIRGYFETLNEKEKDTFFFASWNCLSYDIAKEITWNCFVRPKHEAIVQKIEEEANDQIGKLDIELYESKKENEKLKDKLTYLENQLSSLSSYAHYAKEGSE